MKFVFWQNMFSIHQSAFIRNLALENEVILIVEEEISEERNKTGWTIPDFGNAKTVVDPDTTNIETYLLLEDAIHVFAGINAFPMVTKVFLQAKKMNLRIGTQLEVFESTGFKGFLRKIKYYILQRKFGKSIDFLLVMSEAGCLEYKKIGFEQKKIFNWGYFTETFTTKTSHQIENVLPKLIYVGRLDKNKNILGILPFVVKNLHLIESFTIVGDGEFKEQLNSFVNEKIIYKGICSNYDVNQEISKSDILILPSFYDGWGAVINEALLLGTRVLCSDVCGAADLIKEDRGHVFSYRKGNFEYLFLKIIQEGIVTKEKRKKIATWAAASISGQSASKYFIKVVKHIYNNEEKPTTPWS